MKYTIVLIACALLLAQCKKSDAESAIQPTGTYDTLGIKWTVVESTNIIYHFQDFSIQSGYAKQYVDDHEAAYKNLNGTFKAVLPRKLRFFIWTDETLAAQLLGHSLGFTVPGQCVCFVRPNQTIGHEMTHALVHWMEGTPTQATTRFVNEGVAVAFDLNNYNRIDAAKSALAGQGVQSVRDFWSGSKQSAPEAIFYPAAGAFIDYLYKQNLPNEFRGLLENQTIANAENIYGKARLDSLIAEFDGLVGL
jgi:hypothetical protein